MNELKPAFLMSSPSTESVVKDVRTQIQAWVTSPWLIDLVSLFGGLEQPQANLDALLAELEIFSDRWDFRRIARERGASADDSLSQGQGSARWLSASSGLSPDLEARVFTDVTELGLVRAQAPVRSHYDHLLVLGGARLSCLLRSLQAAEVIRGGVRVGTIILLGAARPVADTERDATDSYAPGAVDEFDLILAGAQNAFGLDLSAYSEERYDAPENRNLSWVVRRYEACFLGQSLKFIAVSAPSTEPLRRRANSADTILFFLDHERIPLHSHLLLVTSQIYVPYVQLEALRTVAVPRQMHPETIGFPVETMPALQGLSNTNHYLQEVRSAIQAAARFCRAYPENAL